MEEASYVVKTLAGLAHFDLMCVCVALWCPWNAECLAALPGLDWAPLGLMKGLPGYFMYSIPGPAVRHGKAGPLYLSCQRSLE
eukprot:1159363-Pelagomonas_calceolata.AAC.15